MRQILLKELEEYSLEKLFPGMELLRITELLETESRRLKEQLGLRGEPIRVHRRNGRLWLKCSGIAGAVELPGLEIEIMPKFCREDDGWRRNLFQMISIAASSRIRLQSVQHMSDSRLNFYDHLALLFLDEMQQALRKEKIRTYRTSEDHSRFLRGRLLFGEQLRHMVESPGIVWYEQDELNCENHFNYLLKWCCGTLASRVRNQQIRRALLETEEQFPAFWRSYPIPVEEKLPPQYRYYERAMDIANRLARGSSSSHDRQGAAGFGYVTAMEVIYEKFIEKLLKSLRAPGMDIRSVPQSSALFARSRGKAGSYFTVPDNKVCIDGRPAVLVDAKYKNNFSEDSFYSRGKKPVNSDVYQLFASLVAHGCTKGILVSPCESSRPSSKQEWTIDNNGQEYTIYSLAVSLSDISTARKLEEVKTVLLEAIQEAAGRVE